MSYTKAKQAVLDKLTFRKAGHRYLHNGFPVQSVTQIIEQQMDEFRGMPKEVRERALLRGDLVHLLTQHNDAGQDMHEAAIGVGLDGYLTAWQDCVRALDLRILETEQRVFHCVHPSTRVLTDDLRWVSARSLRVGDGLLGFDELQEGGKGRSRRYKQATVLNTAEQTAPSYLVRFKSGKALRTTGNHRFLVRRSAGVTWVRTDALWKGAQLPKYFEPWKDNDLSDYDRGFLSGSYNGEGNVHYQWGRYGIEIGFAQKEGPYLQQVREAHIRASILWSEVNDAGVISLRVRGGASQTLRALGLIRPVRLLDNWAAITYKPTMRAVDEDVVEDVSFVGLGPVTALESSSGTYITEGFGSHNTKHRYAGTLDRVVLWEGEVTVLEIKSGPPVKEYALQTAAYQLALNEGRHGDQAKRRLLIQLTEAGRWTPLEHKNKADTAGFLGALAIANWRTSL